MNTLISIFLLLVAPQLAVTYVECSPRECDEQVQEVSLLQAGMSISNFKKSPVKQGVPFFTVDLDKPPKERWTAVTNHYKEELLAMGKALRPILHEHLGENFEAFTKVDFGKEYTDELQGMVDQMNDTDITVENMKLTNMLYELESPVACSAVLLAKADGTVVHGRNMDYGFHFPMPNGDILNWPNVTFEVTFKRKGEKLFTSTMWPGQIGIATAMLDKQGWSFEQQTRTPNTWQENLKAAQEGGGQPNGIAVRKIMESTPDFEEAVDKIYATKFMSPQYFIMAGSKPFQGAVLTIDRLGKHLDDTPPIQKLSNSSKGWRIVQTNDDQLHPPKDPRRPIATEMLAATSQEDISEDHMMKFMHSPPLFNMMTVYSVVMVPKTGYYKTILPSEASSAPKASAKRNRHTRSASFMLDGLAPEAPHA